MAPMRYDYDTVAKVVKEQGLRWKLTRNPFSALSIDEVRRCYGGVITEDARVIYLEERKKALDYIQTNGVVFNPCPECDWRNFHGHNYIKDPQVQGGCGACTAFSIVAALESNLAILNRMSDSDVRDFDLSEADVFFCPYDPRTSCSTGMFIENGLNKVMEKGVVKETILPWDAALQKCMTQNADQIVCPGCGNSRNRGGSHRVDGWHILNTMEEAKEWICNRGPVVAQMAIFTDFNDWFSAGGNPEDEPYHSNATTSDFLNWHAVCVIGFKDTSLNPPEGYWLCKDSSGNYGGYFKIAYNDCAMLSDHVVDGRNYFLPFYAIETIGHWHRPNFNYKLIPVRRWPPGPPIPHSPLENYDGYNEYIRKIKEIGGSVRI